MAIPNDRKSVSSNLPFARLNAVLDALEAEKVAWDESKTSLVGEGCYAEFELEGSKYSFEEIFESVSSVDLISADQVTVQSLIDEHELAIADFVQKRDYRSAEKVNNKIESLKRLLN